MGRQLILAPIRIAALLPLLTKDQFNLSSRTDFGREIIQFRYFFHRLSIEIAEGGISANPYQTFRCRSFPNSTLTTFNNTSFEPPHLNAINLPVFSNMAPSKQDKHEWELPHLREFHQIPVSHRNNLRSFPCVSSALRDSS